MPVANPEGIFHQEAPLEVGDIADLQEIAGGIVDLEFRHEFEYKGVLLVEIFGRPSTTESAGSPATKRLKAIFRAIVLGEAQDEPGKMVLLRRPGKSFQTVCGLELMINKGITAIGNVHWCTGLRIKWVPSFTPSTKSQSASYSEKIIHNPARDEGEK